MKRENIVQQVLLKNQELGEKTAHRVGEDISKSQVQHDGSVANPCLIAVPGSLCAWQGVDSHPSPIQSGWDGYDCSSTSCMLDGGQSSPGHSEYRGCCPRLGV